MNRKEKVGLCLMFAVGLGLVWGVAGIECGVFGAVVGAGLGAIIE